MTMTSFKTIVITNPWEQGKDMQEGNRQDELPTSAHHFGGSFGGHRNSKMGVTALALRSPGGGFKNQRSSQVTIDATQPKPKAKASPNFRKSGLSSLNKTRDLLVSQE